MDLVSIISCINLTESSRCFCFVSPNTKSVCCQAGREARIYCINHKSIDIDIEMGIKGCPTAERAIPSMNNTSRRPLGRSRVLRNNIPTYYGSEDVRSGGGSPASTLLTPAKSQP